VAEWIKATPFLPEAAMKGKTGCPMKIIALPPCVRELAKHGSAELSEKAKHRLEVLDWYYEKPQYYFFPGRTEVTVACQHFGMRRSQFYRRKNRYDPRRPASLEPGTTAPKKKREPEYSRDLAAKVRAVRKEDQTYSGKKIRPILPGRRARRMSPRFQPWAGS
jgi:hypothetical protein